MYLIHRSDQRPHRFQRARKFKLIEQRLQTRRSFARAVSPISLIRWRVAPLRRIGHLAFEIPPDHGQRAAGQIAQPIGQIGVVALHQRIEGERPILPEHDFAQQKIAQRVRAQHIENRFRAHNVAARLRHLALFKQQPAVRDDGFWQRQSGRHQKRRPVDAMEAHNLLADHLHIGRPELLETSCDPRRIRSQSR